MKAVYLKDKTGNKIVTTPYYRVGDLFLTTIATNPSNFLGGKWELFGPGRCLVCVDTSQTEFNSVKKTGGEKTHKLTVSEMPRHKHTNWTAEGGSWARETMSCGNKTSHDQADYGNMDYAGGDQAHNNLQPYITCYVWIRTA